MSGKYLHERVEICEWYTVFDKDFYQQMELVACRLYEAFKTADPWRFYNHNSSEEVL